MNKWDALERIYRYKIREFVYLLNGFELDSREYGADDEGMSFLANCGDTEGCFGRKIYEDEGKGIKFKG